MAALSDVGPASGSAFANLGGLPNHTPVPAMTNAVVTIVLKRGPGEDLVADCHAIFTLESGANQSADDPVIVAFPLSGQRSDAVKISGFDVRIDGRAQKAERHPVMLYGELGKPEPFGVRFEDLANFELDHWRGRSPDTFDAGAWYFDAFCWVQRFRPSSRCEIEVTYGLQLHPQLLSYRKQLSRREDWAIVPYDLMWAGETGGKAYFFDYILRSGSTWSGPIGHETVTLTCDPSLHLNLSAEEIVVLPRDIAAYRDEDTREARKLQHAGISAPHVRKAKDRLVWEIDHEKPTQDIIVEIPRELVH